jgi:exodeoxyribonuclease V alpha subunit
MDPLATRQAELFSRRLVADKSLADEARIVLLLNLAALSRGATRPPRTFLLGPLQKTVVDQLVDTYEQDHPNAVLPWKNVLTDPSTINQVCKFLDNAIQTPERLKPLTGREPADDAGNYPLLITDTRDSGRTGFSRCWRAASRLEKRLREILEERSSSELPDDKAADIITKVFETDSILEPGGRFHFRQVVTAALALKNRFLVVAGGPGTGKTSVVFQILRCLVRAFDALEPDRIVLCAPTGRAKARLGESIDRGVGYLEKKPAAPGRERDLALKDLSRKTVHSLLSVRPDGGTKYDSSNPLPCQVIVVDEASMVDVHLFSLLIEATAPDCRIILLGDMHQLPSVEAGAVLGDLTERFAGLAGFPTLLPETAVWAKKVMEGVLVDKTKDDEANVVLSGNEPQEKAGPLADHAVILTTTYRLSPALAKLSSFVNLGDADGAIRLISNMGASGAAELDTSKGLGTIRQWLEQGYSAEKLACLRAIRGIDLDAAQSPGVGEALDNAFRVLDESRILVLAHEGDRGRFAINMLADRMLRQQLDDSSSTGFYHGQPVMVNSNFHTLDLHNGDIGVAVRAKNNAAKVVFRRGGRYLVHSLDRLSGLEPSYAMTVHKAQGSEFDAVLLVLPEYKSPLLTRQIIYTAITRARQKVVILGSEEMLRLAIATREERPGGIMLE